MANAGHDEVSTLNNSTRHEIISSRFISTPITRIHSIEQQQRAFLFYNQICMAVTGE